MDFFDLVNISERTIELINPLTPEKVVLTGKYLRLREGNRMIDFGCGYGEMLRHWAEHIGLSGVGIDVLSGHIEQARKILMYPGPWFAFIFTEPFE